MLHMASNHEHALEMQDAVGRDTLVQNQVSTGTEYIRNQEQRKCSHRLVTIQPH